MMTGAWAWGRVLVAGMLCVAKYMGALFAPTHSCHVPKSALQTTVYSSINNDSSDSSVFKPKASLTLCSSLTSAPSWPPCPVPRLCCPLPILPSAIELQIFPSRVKINTVSPLSGTFILPRCPQTSQETIPFVSTRRKEL